VQNGGHRDQEQSARGYNDGVIDVDDTLPVEPFVEEVRNANLKLRQKNPIQPCLEPTSQATGQEEEQVLLWYEPKRTSNIAIFQGQSSDRDDA